MATNKENINKKSHEFISLYPKEFTLAVNGMLHCNLCCKEVNPSRKSVVDTHRLTKKHKKGLHTIEGNEEQQFITEKKDTFSDMVISAFSGCDIPLKKAENLKLKNLFNFMKYPLPSARTLRRQLLLSTAPQMRKSLTKNLSGKKIFLIVDESTINNKKYLNILCGELSNPQKVSILTCKILDFSPNSQKIQDEITETLSEYEINPENFMLLISDAAPYMMNASRQLKFLYLNMFHITCLAHLAHNCAMKIRMFYNDVDCLIATMKMLTIKNKTNQKIFESIGSLPSVIITRWSSWLKAALFYADNLPRIKELFYLVKKEGIIAQKATDSIGSSTLTKSLVEIKIRYEKLIFFLDELEETKHSLQTGYNEIKNLFYSNDELGLHSYINQRLKKSDYEKIVGYENENISPSDYSTLINAPCTSILVERSFSMLKRMLRSERNFNDLNVESYFLVYFNSNNENKTKEEDPTKVEEQTTEGN